MPVIAEKGLQYLQIQEPVSEVS